MTHYKESPLHKYAFNEFLDDQKNPVFIGGYPINNLIHDNNQEQPQQGGSNTLGDERLNHLSVPIGLVMNDYSHMANLHGGKYSKDKDQDQVQVQDQDQDPVRSEDDKNHDPINDDLFKKLFGKVERPKVEQPNREKKYTIKNKDKIMTPKKIKTEKINPNQNKGRVRTREP